MTEAAFFSQSSNLWIILPNLDTEGSDPRLTHRITAHVYNHKSMGEKWQWTNAHTSAAVRSQPTYLSQTGSCTQWSHAAVLALETLPGDACLYQNATVLLTFTCFHVWVCFMSHSLVFRAINWTGTDNQKLRKQITCAPGTQKTNKKLATAKTNIKLQNPS